MADTDLTTNPSEKRCSQCGQSLAATSVNFSPQKKGLYGFEAACKPCKAAAAKDRRAKNLVNLSIAYPSPDTSKICSACREAFPATPEYFHRDKYASDGLRTYCKPCGRGMRKKYYYENPELEQERVEIWRQAHKPHLALTAKARRMKNKKLNKVPTEAQRKRQRAATRKFALAHPEVSRHHAKQRRARKANVAINDFTQEQWEILQRVFDHRCAYCGKRAKGRLSREHITPYAKNGNNTLQNIVPACRSCNARKHTNPAPLYVQPLLL